MRPITYMFEVAADADFNSKVFARNNVPPGDGGRTTVQVDRLDIGRAYFWRARAEDGANSSQFSTAQFEVLPKPLLTAPGLVSPINNERVGSKQPTLTVNASDRNKAVGELRYEFQVATDQGFGQLVSAGIVDEMGGQTTFTPNGDLAVDQPALLARAFQRRRGDEPVGPDADVPDAAGADAAAPGPECQDRATADRARRTTATGSCAVSPQNTPERLPAGVSLRSAVGNMEFLRDRIIEAGICGGFDLGGTRSAAGPHSIDFLAHRRAGGDMGVDLGQDY